MSKKVENGNEKFEFEQTSGFVTFLKEYYGAILGGLIALGLCFTEVYKCLLFIVIVCGGVFVGNYVQRNKDAVKEMIINFIKKI